MHTDIPELNSIMEQVGSAINLKKHIVNNAEIIGPGDLEVHQVSVNQFSMITKTLKFVWRTTLITWSMQLVSFLLKILSILKRINEISLKFHI